MKSWILYEHLFPNGKRYIGITSKSPSARWENGSGYSKEHQSVVYNAIQKYGWENIQHNILLENLTEHEAKEKEIEYIEKYHTFIHDTPCYGYNMTKGGEGTTGHIMSQGQKDRARNRFLGKTGKDCVNSKPVVCDGIEYSSLTEFKTKHKNIKGNVGAWLRGTVGMPKYWYDKKLHYKDLGFDIVKCSKTKFVSQCEIDGIKFSSQKQLADYLNVSCATITSWYNGKHQPPQSIADRGLKIDDKERFNCVDTGHKKSIFYDGKQFQSQKELSIYLGVKPATLSAWLVGKNSIPEKYKKKGLIPYN